MIEEDSLCIALTPYAVHSGRDCASLEVTYGDPTVEPTFGPTCALAAQGLYLVGGTFGGVLTSTDGTSWTQSLWQETP